uniref:Dimethyladenosine transferase 1, mitochondrial n=1 Tax=Vermamoeba vermiformis TaxID=5778 RepID=TFB1M_VERVE|nr:RecName: Full=Dimethyladenosine transferase 1, mitochondrial; AltName: Full=Mitochondrial 12S rRNA dimethylase 1; AltName: Full=Mitochondrial transcription factor B1; AltName: Full=S-adenosylmethionine-6-N', N'-adenosyl(rRNA) dimethyltransferase 1; Flags: Precursor [Vermamoeba vermiformis]ABB97064.1 mitochondrial transcription factor B-like protein [Vermamoeba vermiformis]
MTMRLPPLPTIGELIRLFGLSAKQQLSQNFLLDLNITDKIVRSSGDLTNKTVIEVGPGPGGLTRSILKAGAKKLVVIEKDRRFLPALEVLRHAAGNIDGSPWEEAFLTKSEMDAKRYMSYAPNKSRMQIVMNDVLRVDEQEILQHIHAPIDSNDKTQWENMAPITIIGNLPFAISTELTIKWLKQIQGRHGAFRFGRAEFILMFQKEVADRLIANPGTKQYSRLTVMTQQLCSVKKLSDIPGSAFVPKPDVDASLVSMVPRVTPLGVNVPTPTLEYVCRQVFGQRRKMINNSVKTLGPEAEILLARAHIDPTLRPEQLTVPQWCDLARAYQQWENKPQWAPAL